MISTILCMRGNGTVILPKKWLDRYPTKNFLAEEDAFGNLIISPADEILYYERKNGSCGLHFPRGIAVQKFLQLMQKARRKLAAKEKVVKKIRERHGSQKK